MKKKSTPEKSSPTKNTPKKTTPKKTTPKKTTPKKTTPKKLMPKKYDEDSFPIVGIGASAGGLEAIEGFVRNFPSGSNIAFVIIQHLDPKHKSIMDAILRKYTKMNVAVVADGTKVRPDTIYLNPPNKNVALLKRTLLLTDPLETHGVRLPIDHFFRSLAEDQSEASICIVLSGTGTDGTLGLKAIKGAGGMTMAQDEKQAKYDGMPRSAIDTGLVDFILSVENMPVELMKYVRHPYIEGKPEKIEKEEKNFHNYLYKIFVRIRSVTGHDFSDYKENTTRRRIERRMAVHQIENIADYLVLVQDKPAEVELLFKDLLIGVTNFFRDPGAFRVLHSSALPELLKKRDSDSPLRIWVAGCATGEEAYSLAIIFDEIMEKQKIFNKVQIFATDIDPDAIDYARMGIYPDNIAADVSRKRLERYFTKDKNKYTVNKKIRDMVVFAVQNLIKDPPFSRLDMISCRNLLIYMDSGLQKKIFPLFNYTLNSDGILFLGPSESIGEFTECFTPLDAKWKIFRLKKDVTNKPIDHINLPFYGRAMGDQVRIENEDIVKEDIRGMAERIILDSYAPPCVIVNEKYDIIYFIGDTDPFLCPPTGEPSFNIVKMAREGLRYKLSTALHNTARQKKATTVEGLKVRQNGNSRVINLFIRPLHDPAMPTGSMLVVFADTAFSKASGKKSGKPRKDSNEDPRIASMEQELSSTKEYLQTTIEELETSNEELKSTNEELQSVNEEIQSTNEELETSREELQSTNEELVTVNSELQKKVDELSSANNDINNLLASTEIGTIFLDTELRIKRYTPTMTKIINLIQSDIGRPVSDITTSIEYNNFHTDAREVLDTLAQKSIEIKNSEGAWFEMRISPYRTVENVIDGVVITFIDISNIKELGLGLKMSNERFNLAMKNLSLTIAHVDLDLRYTWIHNPHEDFDTDAHIGKRDDEIAQNDGIKRLMQLKQQVINTGVGTREEITFPLSDGSTTYDITLEPLFDTAGQLQGMTTAGVDISQRREIEDILNVSKKLLEVSQHVAKLGTWDWDIERDIITWSDEMYTIFGVDKESFTPGPKNFTDFVHPDDRHIMSEESFKENTMVKKYELNYRIINQKTRDEKDIHLWGDVRHDSNGRPVFIIGTIQDITDIKKTEAELNDIIEDLKGQLKVGKV